MNNKKFVDSIIHKYIGRIGSFAQIRLKNKAEADDLASMIIYEAYVSLLKLNDVQNQNIDGYIYKVSCNVYARYLQEKNKMDALQQIEKHNFVTNDDTHEEAKKAIINERKLVSGYVSLKGITRGIFHKFYYSKIPIEQIASMYEMPVGSIKRHLHEARQHIKYTMEMTDDYEYEIYPHELFTVSVTGLGQTAFRFFKDVYRSSLTLSISVFIYDSPKTIAEIAYYLKIQSSIVQQEISFLLRYNLVKEVLKDKYIANVLIDFSTKEAKEKKNKLFWQYANIVCEKYIPILINTFEKKRILDNIYVPDKDANFLLWNMINYCCYRKLFFPNNDIDWKKYQIKNKAGSYNVALINTLYTYNMEGLSYTPRWYRASGELLFYDKKRKFSKYCFNSYMDARLNFDCYYDNYYEMLFDYIVGKKDKSDFPKGSLKDLYDNYFLRKQNKNDVLNMIIVKKNEADFMKMIPEPPDDFAALNKKLADELFEIDKDQFPKHVHYLYKAYYSSPLALPDIRMRINYKLQNDGVLRRLTPIQYFNVNRLIFADIGNRIVDN